MIVEEASSLAAALIAGGSAIAGTLVGSIVPILHATIAHRRAQKLRGRTRLIRLYVRLLAAITKTHHISWLMLRRQATSNGDFDKWAARAVHLSDELGIVDPDHECTSLAEQVRLASLSAQPTDELDMQNYREPRRKLVRALRMRFRERI